MNKEIDVFVLLLLQEVLHLNTSAQLFYSSIFKGMKMKRLV